jgi:hypothetical protein
MAGARPDRIPLHVAVLPALGIAVWLAVGRVGLGLLALILAAVLLGNVIVAVHHVEVVALRRGGARIDGGAEDARMREEGANRGFIP